jgi:hypothetical protein
MPLEFKRRPPRQPLSPEEVMNFIYLKKIRQQKILEKFKKTNTYKYLNIFNVTCILIYSEMIFCFASTCNFFSYEVESVTPFYSKEILGNKRVFSSAVITTVFGKTYDLRVNDTCDLPKVNSKLYVGRDWILQKEIKTRFEDNPKYYYIKRSSPLLFISIFLGVVTFVLFGYNLNQNKYSLQVLSFLNFLGLFYFLLL